MSPICSKADLNFFENRVKLLQCEGLKDTHTGPTTGSLEFSITDRANFVLRHQIFNGPAPGYPHFGGVGRILYIPVLRLTQ